MAETQDEKVWTRELLKDLQDQCLIAKIGLTKNRIREWLNWCGGQAYVSFSGGKDSTVLLHIARQVDPDIPAVFVDTGLEYPEIREFVKTVDNVTWLKPEMTFRQVLATYGYPLVSKEISNNIAIARRHPDGKVAALFQPGNAHDLKYGGFSKVPWKHLLDSDIPISDQCCSVMKKKPAKQYEKATGRYPIVGIMACESVQRTRNWYRYGCNAFESKRPMSLPMSFWTEQDVLEYLDTFHVPYASVYGDIVKDENCIYRTTGCSRTGCVFCCFGVHLEKEPNRFQRLKQTHPKMWDYCMRPADRGGAWPSIRVGLSKCSDRL